MVLAPPAAADRLIVPFVELSDDDLDRIDLHDGYVDDWANVAGEPVLTGPDAFTGQGYSWFPHYQPADYDFRIWLAWHDATNRIYVAVEQFDDLYQNDYNRASQGGSSHMDHHDSCVELILDGDRSGGSLVLQDYSGLSEWEIAAAESRTAQLYWALPETNDSGPHVSMWRGLRDWMLSPPYSDSSGRRFGGEPIITVVEFYVTPFDHLVPDSPEHSVVSDLYPGKVIGFNLYLYDHDDGSLTIHALSEVMAFTQLNLLSHGVLVGKDQTGSSLDPLATASWGAVKHAAASPDTASVGDQ